jgi:predicted transcriptional regulator
VEENFERLIGSGTMEYKIESVMTAEVVTARPAGSFRELVDLLERHRISAVPVVA